MSHVDSQLVREAREGSNEALNALCERYGERLLALIRLRLGPSQREKLASRHLLQQTLLEAFRQIEQFEDSGGVSLMGWLGGLAEKQIRDRADHSQTAGRNGRDGILESATALPMHQIRTEVRCIELCEQNRRLERAMDRLTPQQREVLLLRRFEELSFPRIGERLGKSADSCRAIYARATAALTLRLHELDVEG